MIVARAATTTKRTRASRTFAAAKIATTTGARVASATATTTAARVASAIATTTAVRAETMMTTTHGSRTCAGAGAARAGTTTMTEVRAGSAGRTTGAGRTAGTTTTRASTSAGATTIAVDTSPGSAERGKGMTGLGTMETTGASAREVM